MLIVFQEVMPKHADRLEVMLDKLPCLKEGDFIGKNARNLPLFTDSVYASASLAQSSMIRTSFGSLQIESILSM